MTNEEKKWKSELQQFRKTGIYEHLQSRRSEKMRSRMAELIDAGLVSEDQKVLRLAQSLREEALFWNEIIGIVDAEEVTTIDSARIVRKMFRDFDDPSSEETHVALRGIGG